MQVLRFVARPLMAVALGLAALPAAGALAADYTVNSCASEAEAPLPMPWTMTAFGSTATQACAASAGYQLQLPDHNLVAKDGGWNAFGVRMSVGPATPSVRINWIWSKVSIAPKVTANALAYGNMQVVDIETGAVVGQLVSWGTDAWPGISGWGLEYDFPAGTRDMRWTVTCYSGCIFGGTPADFTIHRLAVSLHDPVPPREPVPSYAGLLSGEPQRGTRVLTMDVSDADSGVHHAELSSAGTGLGWAAEGQCAYTGPIACPQEKTATWAIDTTKLPEGPQTLDVLVDDASSEVRRVRTPSFVVDNVPDAPAPGAGAAPSAGAPAALFATQLRRGIAKGKHAAVGRILKIAASGLAPGASLAVTCGRGCTSQARGKHTASKSGRVTVRFKHAVLVRRSTRLTLTATMPGRTPASTTFKFVPSHSGLFARRVG